MNYEITGKHITELTNTKTNTTPFLLLILSIVFIPAAYVLLAAVIFKETKNNIKTKLSTPTALLYAYIVIGLISSEYKPISLFFGLLMVLCIHSFNIFENSLATEDIPKFKKYIFIVSLIVFLYGILQYFNPEFVVPNKWVDTTEYNLNKRIYSTFFNPNVFGFYINFIILLLCESLDTKKFNLEWFVFLSAVSCLILTFSRTAWVSLIITLIIAGFLNKKYFKYAFIITALILCTDMFLEAGRTDPAKVAKDTSIIYRFEIWKACIEIIKDNFISGIGFGTLFKHISDYSSTVSIKIEHCHNLYLQIFTETGALGFGIFTFAIIKIFKYFYIKFKFKENKNQWIAPFTVLLMTMIHGLADSVALTPQIMMILCIYGGIIKVTDNNKISINS